MLLEYLRYAIPHLTHEISVFSHSMKFCLFHRIDRKNTKLPYLRYQVCFFVKKLSGNLRMVLFPELWGPTKTFTLVNSRLAALIGPKFFTDNLNGILSI